MGDIDRGSTQVNSPPFPGTTPVITTLGRLFRLTGSNWSRVLVAVLANAPARATRTAIRRRAVAPMERSPTDHCPVARSNVPWVISLTPTNVRPDGNWSVTTTFVAASGPTFCRFKVKNIVDPTATTRALGV